LEEINFHRVDFLSTDDEDMAKLNLQLFIDVYLSFVRFFLPPSISENHRKSFPLFFSLSSSPLEMKNHFEWILGKSSPSFSPPEEKNREKASSLECACFGINNFKLSVFTQLLFANGKRQIDAK
jgi:hypothetical protein